MMQKTQKKQPAEAGCCLTLLTRFVDDKPKAALFSLELRTTLLVRTDADESLQTCLWALAVIALSDVSQPRRKSFFPC
jgi:hypothetical protein